MVAQINKELLLMHLKEAQEELLSLIRELEDSEEVVEDDVKIPIMHLYHHINTGWNARYERADYPKTQSEKEFDGHQQFPVNDFEFMTISDENRAGQRSKDVS